MPRAVKKTLFLDWRNLNMKTERDRHTVWVNPATWDMVRYHYKRDNCSTQNEFIEKAIRFYCGYLEAEHDGDYLPHTLSAVLEGSFTALGDRMGRLLFKLSVEVSMLMHIIAYDTDIDLPTLEKLRARCVQDVMRTHGQISFKDILKFQKEL